MNDSNLKKIRSTSEAREKGRKGGLASGRSRKKMKLFREYLKAALSAEVIVNGKKTTLKEVGAIRLAQSIAKGDINALKYAMELLNEAPSNKVELTGKDGKDLMLNARMLTKEEIKDLWEEMDDEYKGNADEAKKIGFEIESVRHSE